MSGWPIRYNGVTVQQHETLEYLENPPASLQTKLEIALRIAPIMVQDAINAINGYIVAAQLHRSGRQQIDKRVHGETILALLKYFNIEQNRKFDFQCRRILMIYRQILQGLQNPYQVFLYKPTAAQAAQSEKGFVAAEERMKNFLRRHFEAHPDRLGHVDWDDILTDDIHLSYDWLIIEEASADHVARLLVHEGSHKWAMTNDELYKGDSLAADKEQVEMLVEQQMQQAFDRPGRTKKFMPMTSILGPMDTEAWLQNADSYAWAARRLWKRAGRKGL